MRSKAILARQAHEFPPGVQSFGQQGGNVTLPSLLSGCSSAVLDALAEILLWLRVEPLPKETVARMTERAEQLSLPDRDILCQILALAVSSDGGEA